LFSSALVPANPNDVFDPAWERMSERLCALREPTALGMDLARSLAARVAEAETPQASAEAALAFSRVARTVRLSVALAERIERDFEAGSEAQAEIAAQASDPSMVARVKARMRLLARKDEARAFVGRAILAEAAERGDGRRTESLLAGLDERLAESEPDDAAWLERPLGELVAHICRDLSVRCDPAFWEEAVALPQARPAPSVAPHPRPPKPPRAPAPRPWATADSS
jgi:hypothetical protein